MRKNEIIKLTKAQQVVEKELQNLSHPPNVRDALKKTLAGLKDLL